MNDLPDLLARRLPPPWLMLTLAALLGAGLLWAFVELLRQHIQQGENLRHWQRTGALYGAAAAEPAAPARLQTAALGGVTPSQNQP